MTPLSTQWPTSDGKIGDGGGGNKTEPDIKTPIDVPTLDPEI